MVADKYPSGVANSVQPPILNALRVTGNTFDSTVSFAMWVLRKILFQSESFSCKFFIFGGAYNPKNKNNYCHQYKNRVSHQYLNM